MSSTVSHLWNGSCLTCNDVLLLLCVIEWVLLLRLSYVIPWVLDVWSDQSNWVVVMRLETETLRSWDLVWRCTLTNIVLSEGLSCILRYAFLFSMKPCCWVMMMMVCDLNGINVVLLLVHEASLKSIMATCPHMSTTCSHYFAWLTILRHPSILAWRILLNLLLLLKLMRTALRLWLLALSTIWMLLLESTCRRRIDMLLVHYDVGVDVGPREDASWERCWHSSIESMRSS